MIKPFDIYVISISSAFGICTMLLYGMMSITHPFGDMTQALLGFLIGLYMLLFITKMEMDNVSSDNRIMRMNE
jgi:uncharacterized membrane protein